jgi:hypothetical protein
MCNYILPNNGGKQCSRSPQLEYCKVHQKIVKKLEILEKVNFKDYEEFEKIIYISRISYLWGNYICKEEEEGGNLKGRGILTNYSIKYLHMFLIKFAIETRDKLILNFRKNQIVKDDYTIEFIKNEFGINKDVIDFNMPLMRSFYISSRFTKMLTSNSKGVKFSKNTKEILPCIILHLFDKFFKSIPLTKRVRNRDRMNIEEIQKHCNNFFDKYRTKKTTLKNICIELISTKKISIPKKYPTLLLQYHRD